MSHQPDRSSRILPRAAALLLAAAGALHLVLVPEYLAEAPVIGILFLLAVPLTVGPALLIWRSSPRAAWLVGAAVSAGMVAGFVLSRTVGLLGYRSDDWVEGVPSLAVEVLFVALAGVYLSRSAAPVPDRVHA